MDQKPTKKPKKKAVSIGQESEAIRIMAPLLNNYPPIPPDAIRCPICPDTKNQHVFPKFFYLLRHFRRTFYHRDDAVLQSFGIRPPALTPSPPAAKTTRSVVETPRIEKKMPQTTQNEKPMQRKEKTPRILETPEKTTTPRNENEKSCTQCSKRFQTDHYLSLHMERYHNQQEPGEESTSDTPSEESTPPLDLSLADQFDFNNMDIDTDVVCRYCLKGFQDGDCLRSHISWHKRRYDFAILEEDNESPTKKRKRVVEQEPVQKSEVELFSQEEEMRRRMERVQELEAMRRFSIPIEQLRLPANVVGGEEKTYILNEVGIGGASGGFIEVGSSRVLEGRVIQLVEAVNPPESDKIVKQQTMDQNLATTAPQLNKTLVTFEAEILANAASDRNVNAKNQNYPAIVDNTLDVELEHKQLQLETNEKKLHNEIIRYQVRRVLQNLQLGDYEDVGLQFHKAYNCNYCEEEFDTTLEKKAHLKAKHSYFYYSQIHPNSGQQHSSGGQGAASSSQELKGDKQKKAGTKKK